MDESKKMALMAVEALEDKKGADISIIDISEISVLADYFIIANGTNIAVNKEAIFPFFPKVILPNR